MIGTKVGRTKHTRIMPGGALETEHQNLSSGPSSTFVGKKLDEHRGSFILEYPMDKGHIVDGGWDAMESLWEVRNITDEIHIYIYIYKSNICIYFPFSVQDSYILSSVFIF